MQLEEFLGQDVSLLLNTQPFKEWKVERTVDDDVDPLLVGYNFENSVVLLNCDRNDERVSSIFVKSETHRGTTLSEVPFHLNREEVRAKFGSPAKSGGPTTDTVLGDFGAWDRFDRTDFQFHIQYRCDSDGIEMITWMRNDVAP